MLLADSRKYNILITEDGAQKINRESAISFWKGRKPVLNPVME